MQIKSVGQNLGLANNNNKRAENIQKTPHTVLSNDSVAFTGGFKAPNPIVALMDFIAAGGFAASFCIQDGLGFIAPRVGKGLFRDGPVKRDENGNKILDENGQPKRGFNWAYARKEGIREVVTGPSAFVIPWLLLKGINKKFGTGNSVRLDYLDGFKNIFTKYAQDNIDAIKAGNADKKTFYKEVFKSVLDQSINAQPDSVKIKNLDVLAESYADKQIAIEKIHQQYKGFGNRKIRAEKLAEIGSIEDDFMKLRKSHVGGANSDVAIQMLSSDGKVKGGSIGELTTAMKNYFSDAAKNAHESLKKTANADIAEIVKKFTNRRMGSRILTNLGLFTTVALFYTQIPKLYNMGTGGKDPALMYNDDAALQTSTDKADKNDNKNGKDIPFAGKSAIVEKIGDKVFNGSKSKKISDIFELNGPIIPGNAMAVLLYGACIPPRLANAQSKYDYGEIMLRDITAFTALLFGAKALARLFSDGFTKLTGLALNSKNMDGRSAIQKAWDYLNPSDSRHSILSSRQIDSKYTDIHLYKNGIDGFVEFIEKSGGDIKKALANDSNVKGVVDNILKDSGKTFEKATKDEIKEALHLANINKSKKLDALYELFKKPNKLLNRAKTCNSFFGALSTLVLVPGLIIALTDICKAMTDKKRAEENRIKNQLQAQQAPLVPSSKPTMAGFLNKNVA